MHWQLDERVLWRNNDPGTEDRPSYQEEERAKEKQKVRLLLAEAEGKEKLDLYLHKNQRARARLSGGTSGTTGTGL